MVSAPKAASEEKTVYEEHLTPAQIKNGIKKGTLIQSSFNVSQHNVHEVSIKKTITYRNDILKQYL